MLILLTHLYVAKTSPAPSPFVSLFKTLSLSVNTKKWYKMMYEKKTMAKTSPSPSPSLSFKTLSLSLSRHTHSLFQNTLTFHQRKEKKCKK